MRIGGIEPFFRLLPLIKLEKIIANFSVYLLAKIASKKKNDKIKTIEY